MVWKSDFFSWFMRFVSVPPYENWAFWTNFYFSLENGEFFWGQTCCTLFHTKNEEKSQKISTCIRIHTRVYAITWWWGQICPPPGLIGLKVSKNIGVSSYVWRDLVDTMPCSCEGVLWLGPAVASYAIPCWQIKLEAIFISQLEIQNIMGGDCLCLFFRICIYLCLG